MQPETVHAIEISAAIQRFAKQLVVAWKAVLLYPPASAIPKETAKIAATTLAEILAEEGELAFSVGKGGLAWSGQPLLAQNNSFDSFALELYQRSLAEVRFHQGASEQSLAAFLSVVAMEPADLAQAGGIESVLAREAVEAVSVLEARVAVIDADVPPSARREPTIAEVDSLVSGALAGGVNDLKRLVRIVAESEAAGAWITATATDGFDTIRAHDRVTDLAQAAMGLSTEEQPRFQEGIGDAILALPEEERSVLLRDRFLPGARRDQALAAVVAAMDLGEVCGALVGGGQPQSAEEIESLGTAFRDLGLTVGHDDDVAGAAAVAMIAAGFDESVVGDVLARSAPTQVVVAMPDAAASEAIEAPAEQVVRILSAAPSPSEGHPEAEELRALRAEAERGIADADLLAALVNLVDLDPKDQRLGRAIGLIEELLALLVERGDIDAAARAVEGLSRTSEKQGVPAEVAERLAAAAACMSRPSDLRTLLEIARGRSDGDLDRDAAARMLDAIGDRAIEPMLEVLADEPDMAARKALVEVLSGLAEDHIPLLASHLSDPRWYFVRNVVAVLGSARRSTSLPYLQRTLRHGDVRVRRETIRAVRMLPDKLATEMLVAALDDEDVQNVQLAAHSLGMRGDPLAGGPLAQVARGEGRGNRDVAVRLDAIEALGRLGAPEALSTLDALASRRGILSGGRARELGNAAEAAASRIRGGGTA